MSIFVLKTHEPPTRHPYHGGTDHDPLDRLKITVHPTLQAAQAAAQASYERQYGVNEGIDPNDDPDEEYVRLNWIGDDYAHDDGYHEVEYGIEEFENFVPA
jgi:hypothetical protein